MAHAKTEVLPACAVQMPGGQLEQLAAPGEDEYEPAAQSEQPAAPAAAKLPGGQAVQPAAASVPGFVTPPA
jgi:hypothetical protein